MDLRFITEFFRDTFKYIIIVIVVFLLFMFVLGLQQVVGPSMSPNLKEGDVLIVNKLGYRFKDIKRFDIVALRVNDKYMVKRIIGLPGETVEYQNNQLYINGIMYEEKFIDKDKVKTEDFMVNGVIPKNKYLVLGDNREDSQDSRDYGLINKNDIVGKSWFRIWPLNKIKIF